MSNIPKLSEIYEGLIFDIEAELNITIPTSGKSFLRALAAVLAGVIYLYYLAIGQLQKNVFADTADPEASGGTLERFGRVKLNRNPFPATAGEYALTITGVEGSVIAASTTWKSDDTSLNPGFLFVLDDEYTLVSGTNTITVRALTSGIQAELEVGDTLTATIPIANVNASATVTAIVTEPLDGETTEEYRAAILQSYRLEPQGGAAADYRLWSLDAQGVATSYPYAKSGDSNTINLFVEASAGDGTASAPLLAAVEAVVELDPDTTLPILERGRRPLGVLEVYYLSVSPLVVNIDIADFVDITAAKQTAIQSAIVELLAGIRPFVAAIDPVEDKNDILSTNIINAAVLQAVPGSSYGAITLEIDGNNYTTYTFIDGDIPKFGAIAYT